MTVRKTNLYSIQVPPVSREYAEYLNSIYPKIDIKHDTPETAIKWNAAQREVVEYILQTSIKHEFTGEVNRTRPYLKPYTYIQSLLSKAKK